MGCQVSERRPFGKYFRALFTSGDAIKTDTHPGVEGGAFEQQGQVPLDLSQNGHGMVAVMMMTLC